MQDNDFIIEAGYSDQQYWKDLWIYRELFYFLAWRDILVRYKQTVIGVLWALIRPLFTMAVLTLVFGKLAKMPSEGAPYPILVFSAMLPWQFFASSFMGASMSLVVNSNLVSKVYFPRIIIPASSIVVSFIDFLISLAILLLLMMWYQYWPTWRIIVLPFTTLIVIIASLGTSLWISALNIKFRDFKYLVPFVIQFGLYISPVGFSSSIIPGKWRLLYSLNPMVGIIDGFRWSIIRNGPDLYLPGFFLSTVLVLFVLFLGLKYFRKTERTFADII